MHARHTTCTTRTTHRFFSLLSSLVFLLSLFLCSLSLSLSLSPFDVVCVGLVCVCCVCCGVVSVVCVWRGMTRGKPRVQVQNVSVYTFKTLPCVPAKRAHVEHMWAFCGYTRMRFERTHWFFSAYHTHTPHHTTPHTAHTHTAHRVRASVSGPERCHFRGGSQRY